MHLSQTITVSNPSYTNHRSNRHTQSGLRGNVKNPQMGELELGRPWN